MKNILKRLFSIPLLIISLIIYIIILFIGGSFYWIFTGNNIEDFLDDFFNNMVKKYWNL